MKTCRALVPSTIPELEVPCARPASLDGLCPEHVDIRVSVEERDGQFIGLVHVYAVGAEFSLGEEMS